MNRIEKVQKLIQEKQLDALIIDKPIDLYYLVGKQLSLGRLVVEEQGATLFVDGRYFEACQKLTGLSVMLTAGYDNESTFGKWWKFSGKRVGFDADFTTYGQYGDLATLNAELIPLRGPLRRIREIKEKAEIDALKKSALLCKKGFNYICTQLKEGISEKEVAQELEMFWLRLEGDKAGFDPHIAFGEESSQPHYQPSDRHLKMNESILIDIGVIHQHYHSDMTRVVFLGEPHAEIRKIYSIVHEAYQAALQLYRPGVRIEDADRAARELIEQKGYGEYFPHSLGHGVGLEIHESPRMASKGPDKDRLLEAGMVVTLEPGIYLPGIGGVRLEDTLVITEKGHEVIT